MKVDDNDLILKDILNQATAQKGKLDKTDLYEYGKKLVSTRKKIILFFAEIGNTLRYGRKEAIQLKTSYFSTKSIKLITKLNKLFIIEKINDLSEEEFKKYLSLLKEGEILTQNSQHWGRINTLHKSYVFIQEVKENPSTHWLQTFATPDDLGVNFENIEPFQEHGPIHQFIKLDKLSKETLTPDFVPLLQFVLEEKKIKEITNSQIRDLVTCLNIYSKLPVQPGLDRLQETKQLFQLFNEMKSTKGLETKREFQHFLSDNPSIRELITRLSPDFSVPGVIDQLLKIQELTSQLPSLPVDLTFSLTLEEAIQKMEKKLETRASTLPADRFGKFAESFNALTEIESLSKELEELKVIEEEFDLCGKKELFVQFLDKATGKGFQNQKECLEAIKKFKNHDPLLNYAITLVGDKTRELIQLRVHPEKIRAFQQETLNEIEPTTSKVATRLQGQEGIKKRVTQFIINFNKEQLAEAKAQWSSYGPQILTQFTSALSPEAESGEIHYKQLARQLPNLLEIDQLFVQYDAKQLEAEFGLTLSSHAIDYLMSREGEALREQPDFLTNTWPQLVAKLRVVKTKLMEQGVAKDAFDKELNRFLTTSAYASNPEKWLIFDSEPLSKFSQSIQYRINEKGLDDLMESHGKIFADCLMEYLQDNEPNVLTGDVALKDSPVFHTTPFSEQVRLYILPYLIPNLKSTAVLDKEIITSSLLKEPLRPENFQNRLINIARLQSLLPKGASDREKLLVKEFIRHLNPPYLIDLNVNVNTPGMTAAEKEPIAKAETQIREAVQKLVKFCSKEGDPEAVYTPDLIARAVLDLINNQGNPQDPPAVKLQSAANDCDAFFNGDVIKKFKTTCLKLFVEDVAKKTCEDQFKSYTPEIGKLTESLMARFSDPHVGLKSAYAAAYVQDLVNFSVDLCLNYSVPYYVVTEALTAEVKSNHFNFDLNALNKRAQSLKTPLSVPIDIKDKVTAKIQQAAGPQSAVEGIIGVIKVNPFSIVSEFVPRLVEDLLPSQDKKQVEGVKKALVPLGPVFNQSATVGKGLYLITKLLEFIDTTQIDKPAKDFVAEQIKGYNALDLDQIGKLNDRHLYRQALNEQGLGIWITITETISDRLIDIHSKIHSAAKPEKTDTVVDLNSNDLPKLAGDIDIHSKIHSAAKPEKPDTLVDLIGNDLPKLAEDLDTIKEWIQRLPKIIPVIRQFGGGWIANQILKRYVASRLEKVDALDAETKKLISQSLESVIKIALLSTPTLIQNHQIDVYFDFIKKLNETMQKKERPNADVLLIDVMKIVQQGTREMTQYTPILEDAVAHVEQTLLNPSKGD